MFIRSVPKRSLARGVFALVTCWSSSAHAQLDASAATGLGFDVSSLTGPPTTCTSGGNPASCYLTGIEGYDNGTAAAYGSAASRFLSVSTYVLTTGDHYGTGTPTATVSTSFGDTLSIHNAPTSGVVALVLGYDLQASVGCLVGAESSCATAPAVTLLNNQSAVASASLNSPSSPSANVGNVTLASEAARVSGTYVLDLSYNSSAANLLFSLVSDSNCQVGFGIGYCQAQTSGTAWVESVSVLGDPNARITLAPTPSPAPEIDSSSAVAALTFLFGGLAVIRDSRTALRARV